MKPLRLGKVIGQGMERICYANLDNPKTCFKVSKIGHDVQTRREIQYFEFLKKRHIHADFLPTYFGHFQTSDSLVIEQELFASTENVTAQLLDEFLLNASQEEIEDLENRLSHIKSEMIKKNIIISDIRPGNILVLKNRQGTIVRIIFLDGYGSPEFIPLPMYCPFFGKLKIERQWKKFNRHYNNAKNKRQNTK